MLGMTLVSVMLIDNAGRRTLHLYGLGGMFIFSILITISLLLKVFTEPNIYVHAIREDKFQSFILFVHAYTFYAF